MTRMGDDPGKRRGKGTEIRGKKPLMQMNEAYNVRDFSWGRDSPCPVNLIHPFPIKGSWTYPKKGKIQWKKE